MAEQSKFAGALGRLKRSPGGEIPEQVVDAHTERAPDPPAVHNPSAGRAVRRVGKRSDPEFTPTTFFVRKQTKRKVTQLLFEANSTTDLSELVEELLTKRISERSLV